MKISILLCTYNGEKYLKQQLESLFSQSYNDFFLYIHDDGSTDNTLKIISEFTDEYIGRVFLLFDDIKHRGAAQSFMWLLEHVDSDYYMFCDQDDIWLPNKIEKSLDKIIDSEKKYKGKPVVINTNLKVVDENLNTINESFWKYCKIDRALLTTFDYMCVYNSFTGCTMMLNDTAKQIVLPMHPYAVMHDIWIGLKVKAADGILVWIDEPTILYRQHNDNVVGALSVEKKYYLNKILSFRKVVKNNMCLFKMINTIKRYSMIRFLLYKILYFIKRK